MSTPIAEYELIGSQGVGQDFPVRISLFKPEPSERMAPAWSCTVLVEPMWQRPFEIYGEGSFQALCLAAKHAVQMLDTFIEQGGILKYADGEPFEASIFGFQLLPREQ